MVSEKNLEVNTSDPDILILTGPTATGKSSFALKMAKQYPKIEIINADSLLVYREMDIGTAKPTSDEQKSVPHHLINICDPDKNFTAGEFFREAQKAIQRIESQGKRPLIVGGTGFYLKSLLFGLWDAPAADLEFRKKLEEKTNQVLYVNLNEVDPVAANRIGISDRYRLIRSLELIHLTGHTPTVLESQAKKTPDSRFLLCVVDRVQRELQERIHQRTQAMLNLGLIEEVEALQKKFPACRPLNAVGYMQVVAYLEKKVPKGRKIKPGLEGLREEIELATRQLVKSQRTWFRGQKEKLPSMQWLVLDQEKGQLEKIFQTIYGASHR